MDVVSGKNVTLFADHLQMASVASGRHTSCLSLPCCYCLSRRLSFYECCRCRHSYLGPCKAPDGSIRNSHGSYRNSACSCQIGVQGDVCAASRPVDPSCGSQRSLAALGTGAQSRDGRAVLRNASSGSPAVNQTLSHFSRRCSFDLQHQATSGDRP
jgi:hypothetical protein